MAQAIDLGPVDEGIDLGPIGDSYSFMEKAQGVTGAISDFVTENVIGVPLGIVHGTRAGLKDPSNFADKYTQAYNEGIEASRITRNLGTAPESNKYRQATEAILGAPGQAGSEWLKGGAHTANLEFSGDWDQYLESMKHPEATPALSTAGDIAGAILGYGEVAAGTKAGKHAVDVRKRAANIQKIRDIRPEVPSQVIDLGPIEYPKKEKTVLNTIEKSQKRTGTIAKDSKVQLYDKYAVDELALAEEGGMPLKPQVQEPGLDVGINEGAQAPIVRDMKGENIYLPKDTPIERTFVPNDPWSQKLASEYQGPEPLKTRTGQIEKSQEASSMFEQSREAIANREEDRVGRLEEQLTGKLSEQERAQRAQEEQATRDQQKLDWRIKQKIEADQLRRHIVEKTERPNIQRSPLGGVGRKQGGAFDPTVFSEGISKLLGRGKTPKILGYTPKGLTAKLASMGPTDPRDVNKFVEDVLPQASTFKDLNIGQRAISHAINPDNVANIIAKRTNPVISFLNSKLNDIDRMIRNEKQNAVHGEAFKPGIRGWEKRVAGDDGAITLYEKAPKISQEKIRKVAREWQDKSAQLEAMGLKYATDDMYRASGLSNSEIKALRAVENQITKLFDKANALIKRLNPDLPPIAFKPGYVPDIWQGDYRTFVRDKDGNAVRVISNPTWYHAKYMEKKMKEKFPDHDIKTKTVEESKYALNDTSAFAMVHNLLGDTKEANILAKYEAEVKAHRGYKRHGLHKKGAKGSLGSDVGDTKGFAKATEMYLNSGYEFIGDMERQLLERDLQRAFKEKGYDLNKELPETRKYMSSMVANSKGAIENHLKLIDYVLEGIGKGVGLGPNAGRNILGVLNSAASTAWLTSVKFVELNFIQPLMGAGKAAEVQLALQGGNLPAAYGRAILATYIPGMASAEQRAAMSFAKRNGHIDAKFVDAFGVGPMTHDWAKRAVDTVPKHLLGVIEQEMVRTPMFLTFNDILKDVIKDPKERWHAAGALTEYTMTNYSRTQALPIWQRAGFVGDAVKPMKQFAINATGQLMDLTHAAVVGKSAKTTAPLLISLGVAWGLSGVQGSAPAQLADNMIDLINSVLSADNQLPGVEELLIGSGMKDDYIFGMVSKYTGQNLSGSLAFPDIASMGSAPGLQYGKNILKEGGGYLLKDSQGKATEADKMKAALAVAPAQGREIVKEKFTRPGHGVPDPKNEMHSRLPPRDEGTSLKAMITAAEPESEHIQKAHIRAYENEKKREGSGRAVWKTKLINDFINGGQLNQEALDQFVGKGGDPRNLSTSIKKWMVDDILGFYAQEMVKNKGISLVNAMERLEKFRVQLEGQDPKDLADDWQQSQ